MVRLGLWSSSSPASTAAKITPGTKLDNARVDAVECKTSSDAHSSLTGSAFEPAGDIADEASEVITAESALQNSIQDDEWEDLADTKITPNSSIHILAKSDENVPANSQNAVPNDWVDLKEKSESKAKAVAKEKQKHSNRPSDVVQHEVAALRMAQGLLKGELDATKANAANLVAQLQLESADKRQLSTKLADSEVTKNELEAKIAALMKDKAALEAKIGQAASAPAYQRIDSSPKYCCKACGLDLAAAKSVMWSDCKMGKSNESGMLFKATVNAERLGKVTVTHLATGDYEVQDVRCRRCSTGLGWTYLKAFNEKNKFKEGTTILYKRLLSNDQVSH